MSTDHHFPTSTESGATAGPSRPSSARSRTATRVRSRRRVRAGTNPRASAAGRVEIAAPITGPAPSKPARTETARSPSAFDALAERIDERDRPLLAMLLAGEHPDGMAQLTGHSAEALSLRVRALVAKLARRPR